MKEINPVLRLFAALLLIAGSCLTVAADEPQEEAVDFLFVQYAEKVSLDKGRLTLFAVKDDTLYFSDRPDRIVGRLTTQRFTEIWGKGDGSFAQVPPNAVLTVLQEPLPLDLVVVLRNPVLSGGNLTYDVEVLDGPDSGEGAASSLFIDAFGIRPEARQEIRQEARQEVRQETRQARRRIDRRI